MWYVYKYVDPSDNRIFYVGKGRANRLKVHLYRARMWLNNGKPAKYGSNNLHLLRMISKIWDSGNEPIVEIVKDFEVERQAYDFERELISAHKETICNLTDGGEGWTGSQESRLKMSEKRREWLLSEDGQQWRKRMSESRKGAGNPNYGKTEDEEHKKARMKNILAQGKRWNKGLKGDPRCKGFLKGKPSHNSKKCIAIHEPTGESIVAVSKNELTRLLSDHAHKISGSSIGRIIDKDKLFNGWRIKYVKSEQC